jgi:hypothetical protein
MKAPVLKIVLWELGVLGAIVVNTATFPWKYLYENVLLLNQR